MEDLLLNNVIFELLMAKGNGICQEYWKSIGIACFSLWIEPKLQSLSPLTIDLLKKKAYTIHIYNF